MTELMAQLKNLVSGDLRMLSSVLLANYTDLQDAAGGLPPLKISRSCLIKVLKDWRSDLFSSEDVQAWASFVRRGYVSQAPHRMIRPIEIEYDPEDEDLIV